MNLCLRKSRFIDFLKVQSKFIGPGVLASVAYFDPGNYATDLQAGSQFGFSHPFIVLVSGVTALLLQILAARLGCVTGKDLAQLIRELIVGDEGEKKGKYYWRVITLWVIYLISEAGIICCDLAELLGTAIAINLLIPQIPLWAAVLLTSTDVLLVLALFNPYQSKFLTRSMRVFEVFISLLSLTVLIGFIILVARLAPNAKEVMKGYLPSKIVVGEGMYVTVGIIGATIMPHALYLGSKLAVTDRLSSLKEQEAEEKDYISLKQLQTPNVASTPPSALHSSFPAEAPNLNSTLIIEELPSHSAPPSPPLPSPSIPIHLHFPQPVLLRPSSHSSSSTPPRTIERIQSHLLHLTADLSFSLLSFALAINSMILIVGSQAFYVEKFGGDDGYADLWQANHVLGSYLGQGSAFLFALSLFASGQSASITATLAGQVISEGFIRWRTVPWVRRLITRAIGIVPSLIVCLSVGRRGVDNLLVGSQVGLSVALPFALIPLVILTNSNKVMSVKQNSLPSPITQIPIVETPPTELPLPELNDPDVDSKTASLSSKGLAKVFSKFKRKSVEENYVSFANPGWLMPIGWGIAGVIVVADVYALVKT